MSRRVQLRNILKRLFYLCSSELQPKTVVLRHQNPHTRHQILDIARRLPKGDRLSLHYQCSNFAAVTEGEKSPRSLPSSKERSLSVAQNYTNKVFFLN